MLPIEKAKLSLDGLSIGDAFGEKFLDHPEVVQQWIDNQGNNRANQVYE